MATMIITDRDLSTYLKPSRCGLRVYLQMAGEPQGEADPFDAVLAKLTSDLVLSEQARWVPVGEDPSYYQWGHPLRRANAAAKGLRLKRAVLFRPLLSCKRKIKFSWCFLDAEPDFMFYDEDSDNYVIRVCESSKVVDEKQLVAVYARLRFCGYVFQESQGKPPMRLEIVGRDGQVTVVAPGSDNEIASWIESIVFMKRKTKAPWAPVGRTKCGACVFNKRCWGQASERGDAAIVRGMDQGLSNYLRDREDVSTVRELLDRFGNDVQGLANITRSWGQEKRRVGESVARGILVAANSLVSGKEILIKSPGIPGSDQFVMFDLEGTPEKIDERAPIYLWGMQVFGRDRSEYDAAVAPFSADGDRLGWEDFLRRAEDIFARCGDLPFVHWGRYERERIEAYVKLYGDRDGVAARVLANLFDLHVALNDCIALPLPSLGLKVVEKYVGYKRTQIEYGTSLSIRLYMDALAAGEGRKRDELMRQLLTYNREDLEGTWAVFDWLRKRDWNSLDSKIA